MSVLSVCILAVFFWAVSALVAIALCQAAAGPRLVENQNKSGEIEQAF
jgi:hypothetical protein